VKELGNIPLIEQTILLAKLIDALEDVMVIVEFLEPFE